MNLNDLLRERGIDPKTVLIVRHRPPEPELRRVLPWLAAERPRFYNAYQQTQSAKLEPAMMKFVGGGHVASFIGHGPGQALFVGLYSILRATPLTFDQYWSKSEHRELRDVGMCGWTGKDGRTRIQWFELELTDFCAEWVGKLIVQWPPPERSWWRKAATNDMRIYAILEQSALVPALSDWTELHFTWAELGVLPAHAQTTLSQWRGIYFIFDKSDCKGYVGAAYGEENIFGRWKGYAASGHGGNKLLRGRDPSGFQFSILQRLSPDADPAEVIRVEDSWKARLNTRAPFGLNEN